MIHESVIYTTPMEDAVLVLGLKPMYSDTECMGGNDSTLLYRSKSNAFYIVLESGFYIYLHISPFL